MAYSTIPVLRFPRAPDCRGSPHHDRTRGLLQYSVLLLIVAPGMRYHKEEPDEH